jgi:hypothetical protein
MDLRDEYRLFKRDFIRIVASWVLFPRQTIGRIILAFLRCWWWHPDNNRFQKFTFLLFTGVTWSLNFGVIAGGWRYVPLVHVPLNAVWLVAFGIVFGFEFRRIKVGGVELDVIHGEVNTHDNRSD